MSLIKQVLYYIINQVPILLVKLLTYFEISFFLILHQKNKEKKIQQAYSSHFYTSNEFWEEKLNVVTHFVSTPYLRKSESYIL